MGQDAIDVDTPTNSRWSARRWSIRPCGRGVKVVSLVVVTSLKKVASLKRLTWVLGADGSLLSRRRAIGSAGDGVNTHPNPTRIGSRAGSIVAVPGISPVDHPSTFGDSLRFGSWCCMSRSQALVPGAQANRHCWQQGCLRAGVPGPQGRCWIDIQAGSLIRRTPLSSPVPGSRWDTRVCLWKGSRVLWKSSTVPRAGLLDWRLS